MNLQPQRLAELPAFRTVPEADLAELCRYLLPALLPAGTTLYREGEPAKDAALILSGRLSVTVGDGKVIGDAWPGDIIGEAGLFELGGVRSATVTAIAPTRLAMITMEAVRELPRNRGLMALEQRLLNHMAKRLRAANARLEIADHAAHAVHAAVDSPTRPRPTDGPTRPPPTGGPTGARAAAAPDGLLASLRRIFGGVS